MAKNLVQMSINGVLYDIRDQRMATKLDYIHASLTQALEHKQDLATAVVTDNDSVNWIGRLTSGSTSAVTRYKDDYIDTITGPADTHIHSLWFSLGPISYDPADKDNKELEQQRAWSKSFGVEFQELTKRPRILGLDDKDQRAEVNIYGKSLHTEYIDSPLGINYIHPDKVGTIEHNIIGLPQSIPELDCLQWLYYGKRDNETDTTPLLENINIIGNASAITNIALWDFFQKEDNSYYRVLSEERIANKQINKEQKSSNAYKIVTLDENGIIPDIFLGELKSNPLNIGNVQLIDNTGKFIIKNDSVTGDNFVIAIQPSDTDTDTTKLTQTTINTKDITASNITVSDTITTNTLNVNEDASVTGKVSANSAEITNGLSAGSISTKGKVSANSAEIISINASNIQITNKADIQTLDVKGDASVTGTLTAAYLDAVLDLSARNATFSKNIQAKNATITTKTTTNTLEVKDSATITGAVSAGSISTEGAVSAGSATIANLITDTAVSSTKAVGYDNTGKLIPINGVANKIEPIYTSKDLTEVASATTKYIKVADCNWRSTGTLQVLLEGASIQDTLVINFGGGNSETPMLCGHYSGHAGRVLSVIAQSGTAYNSNYSIYIKILQIRTLTVNVALLKGNCTINITESTTAPTNISEWPTSDGLFGDFTGNVTGNATSAGKLTTARTAYVALGNANTTTSVDWSGTTTIPVDGVLSIENGGTGCNTAQAAANTFINSLTTGESVPEDNDYYVAQFVNGGTTTTTYHRRPISKLWEYIKTKIASIVTPNSPTLAWGATSSLGTIGDKTFNVTMPANPNTDTKVTQTVSTSNGSYPILASATANKSSSSTETAIFSTLLNMNPATGQMTGWSNGSAYAICDTVDDVQDKQITLAGLTLTTGMTVTVFFIYDDITSKPRLNVNHLGAKEIYIWSKGSKNRFSGRWSKGTSMTLMFDGTYFIVLGNPIIARADKTLATTGSTNNFTSIRYADGLLIQWGTINLTNYTGNNLQIKFSAYSSLNYSFIYGGINYQFPTSTDETAKRTWTKHTNDVVITFTQRDVPLYKSLDWFTIGY